MEIDGNQFVAVGLIDAQLIFQVVINLPACALRLEIEPLMAIAAHTIDGSASALIFCRVSFIVFSSL